MTPINKIISKEESKCFSKYLNNSDTYEEILEINDTNHNLTIELKSISIKSLFVYNSSIYNYVSDVKLFKLDREDNIKEYIFSSYNNQYVDLNNEKVELQPGEKLKIIIWAFKDNKYSWYCSLLYKLIKKEY